MAPKVGKIGPDTWEGARPETDDATSDLAMLPSGMGSEMGALEDADGATEEPLLLGGLELLGSGRTVGTKIGATGSGRLALP